MIAMRSRRRSAWLVLGLLLPAILAIASGCAGADAPASNQATDINRLWWVMLAIATLVAVVVVVLLFVALFRRPSNATATAGPAERTGQERRWNTFTFVGGGVVPAIILTAIFGYSLVVMRNNQSHGEPDLVVNITARQFDYTFSYVGHPIQEQDVLHLPANRRIKLELTSDDVIHSFWVPELQGKMDMFQGRTTTLWIEDAKPGLYDSRCAEFCGLKHAIMHLPIQVQPPAEFDEWLEGQSP